MFTGGMGGGGGGALSMGIVLYLHDLFTRGARRARAEMNALSGTASTAAASLDHNIGRINRALGFLGTGAAMLATVAFPISDAMRFNDQLTQTHTIVDKTVHSFKDLRDLSMQLAKEFLPTPEQQAAALYDTIAAGIDDPRKAAELLRQANMGSVATRSDLNQIIPGYAATSNAFRMQDGDIETAAKNFEYMNDVMFRAMNVGLFSQSPTVSDLEAIFAHVGKLAPVMSGLGIQFDEMMALAATATVGGQDAQRAFTGLRQMAMDFLKPTARMGNFADFLTAQGLDVPMKSGGVPDFTQIIRDDGVEGLFGLIRGYVLEDYDKAVKALGNEGVQDRLKAMGTNLTEDVPLQDSPEAMAFLEEMANAGIINIDRAVDVFKSVWGLTAALPLITNQYERLGEIINYVKEGDVTMADAFREMSDTAMYAFKKMGSLFRSITTLIGEQGLGLVGMLFKGINQVLKGIIWLIEKFPVLTAVIMNAVTAMGLLLVVMGTVVGMRAMFSIANVAFMKFFDGIAAGSRWARLGLRVAFFDILLIIAAVTAAVSFFSYAWNQGFFGMRETVEKWWGNLKLIARGMGEWRSTMKDGVGEISMETYNALQEAGLFEFYLDMVMLSYRLEILWAGIKHGFTEAFGVIGWAINGFLTNILQPFADFLEYRLGIGALNSVIDKLQKLLDPTQQNIDSWRNLGVVIGHVLAATLMVIIPLTILSHIFRTLTPIIWLARGALMAFRWVIVRAVIPAIIGLAAVIGWPFTILLLILAVVTGGILLAIWAWKTNFLGFRDFMINLWNGLKQILANIGQSIAESFMNNVRAAVSDLNSLIGILNRIPGVDIPAIPMPGGGPTNQLYPQEGVMDPSQYDPDNPDIDGSGLVAGALDHMSPEQRALAEPLLNRYRSPDSEGGSTVTTGELQALITAVQQLLTQPIEVPVSVDGREIARAVGNYQERQARTSGGAW